LWGCSNKAADDKVNIFLSSDCNYQYVFIFFMFLKVVKTLVLSFPFAIWANQNTKNKFNEVSVMQRYRLVQVWHHFVGQNIDMPFVSCPYFFTVCGPYYTVKNACEIYSYLL